MGRDAGPTGGGEGATSGDSSGRGGTNSGGERGSDTAIDNALNDFFGEVDDFEGSYRNDENTLGLTQQEIDHMKFKAKDIAKNLVAKVVDTVTMTVPAIGLTNIATKLYSGKTIGDHVTNAVSKALADGMSEAEAEAAGTKAAKDAVSAEAPADEQGREERDAVLGVVDGILTGQIETLEQEQATANAPTPGTWDDYVSQFFGTDEGMTSAKDMLQGQADYMKQQYEDWRVNRGAPLNDYTATTEKQSGLLDDLIDQSKDGSGLFSPVSFTLAGQQVSFVPRAQRDQASQLAGFGQTDVTNAAALYDAKAKAADATYENSLGTSPQAAGLAFLDQLQTLAKGTEAINLGRDSLTQRGSIADADREANNPGFLDYLKGAGTILDSLDSFMG